MKEKLTIIATYEENTTDKDYSDFQQYVEAIAKDYTSKWDSCEATIEVDGQTFTARQVGNRHEDDDELSSALKGYPWQKASEGMPEHEGFVLVAIKDDAGQFKMQMSYFHIEGEKRWFAATQGILIGHNDISAKIRVPENLYWRYIAAPNF